MSHSTFNFSRKAICKANSAELTSGSFKQINFQPEKDYPTTKAFANTKLTKYLSENSLNTLDAFSKQINIHSIKLFKETYEMDTENKTVIERTCASRANSNKQDETPYSFQNAKLVLLNASESNKMINQNKQHRSRDYNSFGSEHDEFQEVCQELNNEVFENIENDGDTSNYENSSSEPNDGDDDKSVSINANDSASNKNLNRTGQSNRIT